MACLSSVVKLGAAIREGSFASLFKTSRRDESAFAVESRADTLDAAVYC